MTCKYCAHTMTDNSYLNFDRTTTLFFRCNKCHAIYCKRDDIEKWYTAEAYEKHVQEEGLK